MAINNKKGQSSEELQRYEECVEILLNSPHPEITAALSQEVCGLGCEIDVVVGRANEEIGMAAVWVPIHDTVPWIDTVIDITGMDQTKADNVFSDLLSHTDGTERYLNDRYNVSQTWGDLWLVDEIASLRECKGELCLNDPRGLLGDAP